MYICMYKYIYIYLYYMHINMVLLIVVFCTSKDNDCVKFDQPTTLVGQAVRYL